MISLPLAILALFSPSPNNSVAQSIFLPVAFFAIFYFFMIRPQQTQRRQHEQLVRTLRKGDEVVTTGGIVGEVVHIKETMKDGQPAPTMDDRVTIKSGESRLVVERGKITRVVGRESAASA